MEQSAHQHNHHEHHNHAHRPHQHAASEHDAHAGHSVAQFKSKFWLSLLLTLPVLAYSEMIQHWLHFTPPAFPGSEYVPFVLGTIIFFYGGLVFIRGALSELAAKRPGMMTLISLAITAAYGYSVATQFFITGEDFFWELATLVTIMLLGHWLEMAAIARAASALDALKKLLPDTAEKLVDGKPQRTAVSELVVGDHILVRPGGSIPVDGSVITGTSSVNEAAITGESNPILKVAGDSVIAGTINQDGALTIVVTKTGDATALAGIMRLVTDAQASKSETQILADKAAYALTLVALGTALLTFVLWIIFKDTGFALERAVTVLIIACPHALGLVIPLVVSISTTLAARNGLLVRRRYALETARSIDMVLFDKTGTLTRGEHGVTGIYPAKGYSTDDIVQLTASLEQESEHIIAKGILAYAHEKGLPALLVSKFSALPGLGVQATLKGHGTLIAAGAPYIREQGLTVPPEIARPLKAAAQHGASEVYLVQGKKVIGGLTLADQVREESTQAIQQLSQLGVKTAMITGDSEAVAQHVARQLGIAKYFAEVRPAGKAEIVERLQKQGLRVAMVGDGINDAPALAKADIGIAIGSGTDVAVTSADIILVQNNPLDVVKIIRLSRATYRKMAQNLVWAVGYNIFAIPLAAGALYGFGIILSPAVGAILMSLSTIVVALNAQLLRRATLT